MKKIFPYACLLFLLILTACASGPDKIGKGDSGTAHDSNGDSVTVTFDSLSSDSIWFNVTVETKSGSSTYSLNPNLGSTEIAPGIEIEPVWENKTPLIDFIYTDGGL